MSSSTTTTTTKKRYGTYGRAITSPALLSSTVAWTRPNASSQIERLRSLATPSTTSTTTTTTSTINHHEYAVPSIVKPPKSRAERLRHRISDRRTNTYMLPPSRDMAIDALMNKYLNKSGENMATSSSTIVEQSRADELLTRKRSTTTSQRETSPTIDSLMKRYGKSGGSAHRIKDETTITASENQKSTSTVTSSKLENKSCKEARLSGSEVRIKWEVASTELKPTTSIKKFSVTIDPARMPVGGSGSRSGRLARISQSNIRPYGSNGSSNNCFGPGTHPMTGADPPTSPTKKEPKHRFEITKKLGSGTYGKVSLAYDHKFDREVAVKLIKKSAIENKADLVRIRREIRIMSALNHPNIIQIYEVFENKDKIILVMEYSSGGELYDYVSRCGSLPEVEARRIFRQITSAVLYCHKHKVAHRDLKLENILLDQNNNAKIADFGLSNYFGEKSLLTTFCGSPLYASPEIINGTPYRGPEVDCWSLGILLYTLVYGSMPFDGRDFNRMVRQIKRGAYYEPETPSTASMLIRNMLRVNPDRRATIFDIASHWWLNLEENMPVIQELPENQIIDHTPLTEREETMVVQDLADEQDVFMEFGHLSTETRRKIEDFRRRRKEAEEYNENSPVKPPKARKTVEEISGKKVEHLNDEMKASEKSLRAVKEDKKTTIDSSDPLERLRQIENRLGRPKKETTSSRVDEIRKHKTSTTEKQPEDPTPARQQTTSTKAADSRAPTFVPVMETSTTSTRPSTTNRAHLTASNYRIETDSLNMLMNQVLEQMEKGPVNLNIIARIKAHPLYDTRPMVKELLESIIAAQPEPVQQQTSKIIEQQQSQTFSRHNTLNRKSKKPTTTTTTLESEVEEIPAVPSPPKNERKMTDRPWHSVEVGFDPDDEDGNHADDEIDDGRHAEILEAAAMNRMQESIASNATEVTVQDTSFEDDSDDENHHKETTPTSKAPKLIIDKQSEEDHIDVDGVDDEDDDDDDTDDYSDSEMEELADEVEKKVAPEALTINTEAMTTTTTSPLTNVEPTNNNHLEANPPPDPSSSPQFLDAFDRGLIKRQSKGKYQHTLITNYGRGVSTECESPTQQRKFFGGPQPSAELSPFLFDKAKEILQTYPNNKLDVKQVDSELRRKLRMEKVKADLLKQPKDGEKPRNSYVGSVPPRSPPPIIVKSDDEELDEDDEDEEIEEEEEEELDEDSSDNSAEGSDFENVRPKRPIITAVRRDDGAILPVPSSIARPTIIAIQSPKVSNPKYQVHQKPSTMMTTTSAKDADTTSAKYLVSVAELKVKPTAHQDMIETKLKDQLKDTEIGAASEKKLSQTNLLFRPSAYMASDLYRRINASPNYEVKSGGGVNGSDNDPKDGKETWESASAYIRRKNRERRARNRTIGTTEEIQRALERRTPHEDRAFSPSTTDPFYSNHHAANPGSALGYVRPRYHDESYRTHEYHRAISPTKYSAAVSRDDRGKSQSHDPYDSRPSYDRNYLSTSNASPSYTRKFEHESPSLSSWANERKFEVYKTRAERDAERNTTYHSQPTSGGSTAPIAPSSYFSTSSSHHRPSTGSNTFYSDRSVVASGLRRPDDSGYMPAATASNHYSNRYDGGRSTTPSNDHYAISSALADNQASSMANRFRPSARRVASAMTDAERRSYHRSRSMDRNKIDFDYSGSALTRLTTTPDTTTAASGANDYSYVNYHDSSSNGGRSTVTFDRDGQPRSILKNKQSADVEPRVEPSYDSSGVRSVFERLRRHLSLEKSRSPPQRQQISSVGPHGRNVMDSQASSNLDNSAKKKRSLLSFNRRKTSEVRIGSDGKLITSSNGYDDSGTSSARRPSSPIDRIKSFFRKSELATPSTSTHSDYYNSSASSRPYTSSIQSSSQSSSRDPYVAQYRKYPGSTTTSRDTALNRYSYTPGLSDQRRHWYDDPNIY